MASERSQLCKDTRGGTDGEVFADATVFKPGVPGISFQQSRQLYESWASVGTYDEVMNEQVYRGPAAMCGVVEDLYPTDRDTPLILDVCCGSGLVGEKGLVVQLRQQGFRRFHGIDANGGMLKMAEQKKVYDKLLCCYLDSNPLPLDPDTYDCAVMCGGFCGGHVPVEALRQLIRVVKPGGILSFVVRERFLTDVPEYKGKLENEMVSMEKEGLWQRVSRTELPNYFFHHAGLVFTYRRAAL